MSSDLDVSDPAITETYEKVRSDSDATAWMILNYTDNTYKKLVLGATGEGVGEEGLNEVKAKLEDDKSQFVFIKFITGDSESKRAKFLFVSWVGERVSPLKRAKISVHKPIVKTVIKNFACEDHCTTQDDVNYAKFLRMLVKAGGANYSGNVAEAAQ
eukprot:TRINITY_DN18902_c0_g1_i1.p1 TRINITY_DN18902_c0_g1~~TRINITY_DN18902_c0_g1_i1.p1  ORF type:complete len:157 (-),score=65.12 TRINITY_DN18902_c0_g1_i1:136-606(-)